MPADASSLLAPAEKVRVADLAAEYGCTARWLTAVAAAAGVLIPAGRKLWVRRSDLPALEEAMRKRSRRKAKPESAPKARPYVPKHLGLGRRVKAIR